MTNNNEEPLTVLICGGGIVGLALAMAVKKHLGIMPEIYEKTGTFATEAGAGLGMYPNGLRVLRDISPELLQNVRNAGYPYKCRLWERHDGTEITAGQESILAGDEADLEPIGIRRSSLQKVLYKYAIEQGIKVHFRKPLLSALERDDGLTEVKFGDGTSRLTQILFGADGAWGKSRSIVAGPNEPALKYTGVTCFMGLANVPREGISFPSSDKDDFHAVFFPTTENEQCFQFHMPIPEEEANALNWGTLTDSVSQAQCRKMAAKLRSEGWHERFIEPLENTIQAVNVGFALLEPRLKTWVKGHVALVGDAAHPPVPYVGQGAQQGLEDAGVAVSLLKIYCMDANGKFNIKNWGKAMDLYQKIRISRSSRILDFSKSLGNLQAKRAGDTKKTSIADEALRGEVLMYGTLPLMMNGADHDYKADIVKATQDQNLPTVTAEASMQAMDYLLGIGQIPCSTVAHKRDELQFNDAMYALSAERNSALTDWCFNVMHQLLREVVAHHNVKKNKTSMADLGWLDDSLSSIGSSGIALDEIQSVINLPAGEMHEEDPNSVVIKETVINQLKDLIEGISRLYRRNPFHNFEHAVNVAVAVYRFLSKMATEDTVDVTIQDEKLKITDPLTKFACVFAALIHDADHEGVPNAQLQKEQPMMADEYRNQALAEQHSVDIGWGLFVGEQYDELRALIYRDYDDYQLMRQIIVNIILATDICDKSLKELRNNNWEKAFSTQDDIENINRKTTISLESLIQASDISHTMQPFQIYTKWNERLFCEMYKAYLDGRSDADPSEVLVQG